MRYFEITIKARIDEAEYEELKNDGCDDAKIMASFKRFFPLNSMPVPCNDAEITDIKLVEEK